MTVELTEEKVSTPLDPPLPPLPHPLPDLRTDQAAWADLQRLFSLPINVPTYLCVDEDVEDFICPVTSCFMFDPVQASDGGIYEREAIFNRLASGQKSSFYTNQPLTATALITATAVRADIDAAIARQPELAESQYLPGPWIRGVHAACQSGRVDSLEEFTKRNKRLLLAVDPRNQLLPLHQALRHTHSLSTLMRLLEEYRPGLGLASLLHPDSTGQLPLEFALRTGKPIPVIIMLMALMGEALASFQLNNPLPVEAQTTLDALVAACIQCRNPAWIDCVCAWEVGVKAKSEEEQALQSAIREAKHQAALSILTWLVEKDTLPATAQLQDQTPHQSTTDIYGSDWEGIDSGKSETKQMLELQQKLATPLLKESKREESTAPLSTNVAGFFHTAPAIPLSTADAVLNPAAASNIADQREAMVVANPNPALAPD